MIENLQSLKSLHTFSLQAACNKIKTVDSLDSLIAAIDSMNASEYMVIGEGSNTVFVEDYRACVIVNQIKGKTIAEDKDNVYLAVGAGENWHELVTYCIEHNIGGFENLALIPGTVGAAPIQNIGAYGVELEQFIDKVFFLNTETMQVESLYREQCEFAYRDSIFKRQALNSRIITQVNFVLPKVYSPVTHYGPLAALENPSAKDVYQQVINIRRSKLPDVNKLGNAGSFFKNPIIALSHYQRLISDYPEMPSFPVSEESVKIPAAWLIDRLGFKGLRVGGVACYESQALVLVNLGTGTGAELLQLATSIMDKVYQSFGIQLENEVRLIGQQGAIQL